MYHIRRNFCGLNISWVKCLWLKATHENLPPRNFCHLDILLDGKMPAEFRKKATLYACVDTMFTTTYSGWEAAVGEMLVCVREPRNAHDRYEVAGEKDGTVIDHLFVVTKFLWLR